MLTKTSRILVTGATGMVGGAMTRKLRAAGFERVLAPTRAELDLTDAASVEAYFAREQPEHAMLFAAKVGGIVANMSDQLGFMVENAKMEINFFEACLRHRPASVLFLGSSCIYPRECPQPIREDYLLTGPLEPTNEGYALAKIMGLRIAQALRKQHGLRTACAMPCNVYGTGDHYDLTQSHVLSALVRRFVDAVDGGAREVTLWGTGNPRREFIHVDDLVDALLVVAERWDDERLINVGSGVDVTIRELAALVADATGFDGEVRWDTSKPDGMPRKCMDVSRLAGLGFQCAIDLPTGVARTVAEYRALKAAGAPGATR